MIKILLAFHLFISLSWSQDDVAFQMQFDEESKSMQPKNIAIIQFLRGKFTITLADGKKIKAKQGLGIPKGAVIESGEKSYIKLVMIDKTVISIGPKSKFEFEKYLHTKESEKRSNVLNLIEGKIRAHYNEKSNPDKVKLKAGAAAMGIRGTKILSNVIGKGDKKKAQIALLEGEVDIDVSPLGIPKVTTIELKSGELIDTQSLIKQQKKVIYKLGEKEHHFLSGEGNKEQDILPLLNFDPPEKTEGEKLSKNDQQEDGTAKHHEGKRNKSWQQILNQQINTPSDKKVLSPEEQDAKQKKMQKLLQRPEEQLPRCRYMRECLQYKIHTVNGKKVEICAKENVVPYPKGCRP